MKAKDGAGSATLSMAFAGARFVGSLLKAIVLKETGVKECSFVRTDIVPGLDYFSSVIEFGVNGIEKVYPLPALSAFEQTLFDACVPELKTSISKGVEFVAETA